MLASYAQLEAAWINAGGSRVMAPIMAAVAIAESHPPGRTDVANTDALNPNDNNGQQSSFGAWQISNGTHSPPASNWNDLNENARLAVGKFHSQGIQAWGTYTSGAWRQYYHSGVTPNASGIHTTGITIPNPLNPFGLPIPGLPGGGGGLGAIGSDIGLAGHILGDVGNPEWWKRIGKGAIGGGLVLAGVYLMMRQHDVHPAEVAKNVGEKAGTVAALIPK